MQSEEFDTKIKRAADHHHPAYDEQAWNKMEQLLDKHLPQEKDDRRRFIFFLLLFLLLGVSAWLVATKPWAANKSSIAQVKEKNDMSSNQKTINNKKDDKKGETRINTSTSDKNEIEKPVTTTVAGTTEEPKLNIETNDNPVTSNNNSSSIPVARITTTKMDKPLTAPAVTAKQRNKFFKAITGTKNKQTREKQKIVVSNDKQKNVVSNKPQQQKGDNDIVPSIVNADVVTTTGTTKMNTDIRKVTDNKDVLAEDSAAMKKNSPVDTMQTKKASEPIVEKPVAQKAKNKKANTFFLTMSTGPDVSFAGGDKLGKAKLVAGLGIGYTFKNRLTIRTGFYTGRKIYSASAAEYNPPADFYVHYPYLQKVDADCKVYEIPLSLSYNFVATKKQNWFVSTGLSSYLMKSESYNYFYKYTMPGPILNKQWTIKDANKHFFSVLTLSGGYQRNLSKSLSLMVEPYVKIPLSGVGYGKVKLNSTGLLFSVGIRPFSSSKKQQR